MHLCLRPKVLCVESKVAYVCLSDCLMLKSNSFLDVGCSVGAHALEMAKSFAAVTGIDVDASSIKIAKEMKVCHRAWHQQSITMKMLLTSCARCVPMACFFLFHSLMLMGYVGSVLSCTTCYLLHFLLSNVCTPCCRKLVLQPSI